MSCGFIVFKNTVLQFCFYQNLLTYSLLLGTLHIDDDPTH